jgi:hypothetical protein
MANQKANAVWLLDHVDPPLVGGVLGPAKLSPLAYKIVQSDADGTFLVISLWVSRLNRG